MNKKSISLILLILFIIGAVISGANLILEDKNTTENQTGTISINGKNVNYEKTGKCLEVYDGDTIWVYGVGKVQLTQVNAPEKGQNGFSEAKNFVEEKCLGKTVYLNVDDEKPQDDYGRTLAVVYTQNSNVNKEIIENDLAEVSYFEPSEFEKGEL